MIKLKKINKDGFTLIELLIAMAVFAFVLMLFVFGFIQINRLFTKGTTIKSLNETGRLVIEDVAKNVRVSSGAEVLPDPAGSPGDRRLCLDNGVRYGWNTFNNGGEKYQEVGGAVSEEDFALVKSFTGACSDPFVVGDGSQVDENDLKTSGLTGLIENNIVIQKFLVEPVDGGLKLDLILSTKEADLLEPAGVDEIVKCSGGVQGSQFCDTVRFQTIVTFRNAGN